MNFKHLHYFWVTAKAGGVVRAGEQLHTTPQTLSGQIKLLEESAGPASCSRRAAATWSSPKTAASRWRYADEIFALGSELEVDGARRSAAASKVLELSVGCGGLGGQVRLPTGCWSRRWPLAEPVRLICSEGKFRRPAGAAGAATSWTW